MVSAGQSATATVTVAVAVWPADTIIYLLSLRIFSLY